MKLVQINDYTEVARIAGDGREQYHRTVIADTDFGDQIEIRGAMQTAWVRFAGNVKVRFDFVGIVGPDRNGSKSGLFLENFA